MLRLASVTMALALLVSANASPASAQQELTPKQTQIVKTVNTVFTAAQADDTTLFDSVLAPNFYIFDGGARFNGDSIMAFIKAQHRAGKRYEWSITEPDVHISGKTAWIAYINKGRITDASGTIDQQWLESAFLEKQAGSWKIVFMHSTRVPMASQKDRKQ
ncbi:nuclear transport factor 2 family protein [Acidisarcina polymorpha]|nr:nuclear transport factor 2 family protein [Acidisarcina polymorpha]